MKVIDNMYREQNGCEIEKFAYFNEDHKIGYLIEDEEIFGYEVKDGAAYLVLCVCDFYQEDDTDIQTILKMGHEIIEEWNTWSGDMDLFKADLFDLDFCYSYVRDFVDLEIDYNAELIYDTDNED